MPVNPRGDAIDTTALDALFEPVRRSNAPGLVVGVAWRGHPVYRRGFGLASVQHGIANLPTTRMRIASISKHFTSLACLLLAQDGRLDIDAPAQEYLPELQGPGATATLRQFMNHTSGYRCTLEMGTIANALALQPRDWQMQALARQTDGNFAPGRGHTYCNGTYHALSEIIERVAGVSYETFVKERIFTPLGMHDTESVRNGALMVPGMASLHVRAPNGGWQAAPCESELRGDGGVVSTVDDMLRWLRHLNGRKRVGSPETWRQLLEPATLANGEMTTYTLGLKRHLYRGVEVIHHSGGLIGLHAQLLTVPEHGLDIAIMVNGAPVSATQLSWRIVDALLEDKFGKPRIVARAQEFSHLLERCYRNKSGMTLAFDASKGNDQLTASIFHMPPAPFFYDEGPVIRAGFEDIGLGPYIIAKAELAAEADGQAPEQINMSISGEPETFELLPLQAPDVTELVSSLSGRYYSKDLQAAAEIVLDDMALYLRGDYSGRRRLELRALSQIDFVATETPPHEGRHAINFEIEEGIACAFWIDTYRARRIRFERIIDSPHSP